MEQNQAQAATVNHAEPEPELKIPLAPIYHPSEEEWKDPMKFINGITPEASKFGIVKIIPPLGWEPPFTIDPDKLKFFPRIQPLKFLLAQTRQRAKWVETYEIFCQSVGQDVKYPTYNDKTVDMHLLNSLMEKELSSFSDFEQIPDQAWSTIASSVGLDEDENAVAFLKDIYKSYLQPFNSLKPVESATSNSTSFGYSAKSGVKGRKRKRGRPALTRNQLNQIKNGELENGNQNPKIKDLYTGLMILRQGKAEPDICTSCKDIVVQGSEIIGCIDCSELFHYGCVEKRPEEDKMSLWTCKACVSRRLSKNAQFEFGFEDSNISYDLAMFGEMADSFKKNYFSVSNPSNVPEDKVEREFWKQVMSPDSTIKVMYGADIHTLIHGSGFPVKNSNNLKNSSLRDKFKHGNGDAQRYEDCGWNLTNLPKLPESVLRFIKQDISGMTVPWLYIGMLFSAFCWHNEDHWTASINYLHFGETKTWYGVPGKDAPEFEKRMQECAPVLFKNQPDLLHQLVTLVHPKELVAGDVRVYKVDQHIGEFTLTFPRAYHAGFNQGFNCAEAVNFATASWLQHGFESIGHYAKHRRMCVFSHEEMLCEMAKNPQLLSFSEASEAHQQLCLLSDAERKFRAEMDEVGVKTRLMVLFEDIRDDDDRTCLHCRTTVFLSALTCSCKKEKEKENQEEKELSLVCRNHAKQLCHCRVSKRVLLYRYSIDEIENFCEALLKRVKEIAETEKENREAKVPGPGPGAGPGRKRKLQ